RVSSTLIFERGSRSFMAGLRAAHLRRNGEQNGSREIRKNRSGLATGDGYVSRVPPFSRAADYSPGLVFHAKRFIYSGISLKVSRCPPTLSQTKWRITTEAENSARGSAFVFAMEIVTGGLAGEFAQQGRFCTGRSDV